ncbi:hypothetical protein DBR47_00500 [Paucibacter sp. KBW04]|nr:hypothetical protein DBR47_00500 [Paucibacter sp. KBW04]
MGLVLLLHLLLLAWALLAQHSPAEARRPLPAQAWSHIVLSLLKEKPQPPVRAQAPAPARPTRAAAQPIEPSPLAASNEAPTPAAPRSTEVAGDSARPGLNLQIPLNLKPRSDEGSAAAVRDQALRDPRANSPRLSLDEKLAAAIGGGCFLDERLPDGSVQRRPGRWQTVKAASASTDPFSEFKGIATVNICVKEVG